MRMSFGYLSRALHSGGLEQSDEPTHVFHDVHRPDVVALLPAAR
jgi:hypothetical protein